MKAASIEDIKKELKELPPKKVMELTLRIARFRKENKELLTYLLFEAGDEAGYVSSLKLEIEEMLSSVEKGPISPVKKQLRRIIRLINRHVRYTGTKVSHVELLLHFCEKLKGHDQDLLSSSKIYSLYEMQLHKVRKLLPDVDDDLQYDYEQKINSLTEEVPKKKWLGKKFLTL